MNAVYLLSFYCAIDLLTDGMHILTSTTTLALCEGGYIVILQLFSPLGGWIGDIKYGRYKTIKGSLLFLAIMSVIPIAVSCVNLVRFNHPTLLMHSGVRVVALIVLFCLIIASIGGFISFLANSIPFAMDQLRDAPAQELRLFIHWYVWTMFLAEVVIAFLTDVLLSKDPFMTLHNTANSDAIMHVLNLTGTILIILVSIVIFVTLVVSFVVLHRRQEWFNIEHSITNPYKLVYEVTKFASQHKRPIHRSAFTYCEEKLPSGLDLGKSKYGGPFTTEEVEDVKVFYEILKVMFASGPVYLLIYLPNGLNYLTDFRIIYLCNGNLSQLLIVMTIPLCICLSCLFRACSLHILRSLRKLEISTIVVLINILFLLGVNIASHIRSEDLSCLFQSSGSTSPVFTPLQMAVMLLVQQGLSSASQALFFISFYEFISAQSPHSMKGMLIGLSFTLRGIFGLLAMGLQAPFLYWKYSSPDCGFVYYSMNILLGVVSFILLVWIVKRFKYRERDEPSRERQFAEECYSRNIQRELLLTQNYS